MMKLNSGLYSCCSSITNFTVHVNFLSQRRSADSTSIDSSPNKQHWCYRIPRDTLPASLTPPLAKPLTTAGGEKNISVVPFLCAVLQTYGFNIAIECKEYLIHSLR